MYVRVLRAEQLFPCLRPTSARLLPSWKRVLGTSTPGLSPTYLINQLPSHYTLRTPYNLPGSDSVWEDLTLPRSSRTCLVRFSPLGSGMLSDKLPDNRRARNLQIKPQQI